MSEKSVIQKLEENDKDKDKPWFEHFKTYLIFAMLTVNPDFSNEEMIKDFYMYSKKDFLDNHIKDKGK